MAREQSSGEPPRHDGRKIGGFDRGGSNVEEPGVAGSRTRGSGVAEPPRPTSGEMWVTGIWVVLAIGLSFPVYDLANRVEPILLGLPFGLFYVVAWIVATTVALLVLYRWERRKGVR